MLLTPLVAIAFSCSPHSPAPKGVSSTAVTQDSLSLQSATSPVDSLTYEQRQGRIVYQKYCVICHGNEGRGDGFNAFNLDPKPRDFTDSHFQSAVSDARLRETVELGGRGTNKSPFMPTWGGRLDANEIQNVVAYVRYLGGRNVTN